MAKNILKSTKDPYTITKLDSMKEVAEEILKYYSEHEDEKVYYSSWGDNKIRLYTSCDGGIEFTF